MIPSLYQTTQTLLLVTDCFTYANNLFIFTFVKQQMKAQFFLLLFLISLTVVGQNPGQTRLYKQMDEAVILMEQGRYDEAEKEFLYVMKNLESLPSNLAYYFGKNSFHLKKYKQSINWLNKYLQLKGTGGRFYTEASDVLQSAEEEYRIQVQSKRSDLHANLSGGEYDCGGLDKMICPVCRGQGVVLKKGPFEILYQTCPYSAGEAYLTCEEYNLFMKGELAPKIN